MASMKMCKQQPAPCGPAAPAPAHGARGPCAAPEKKQPTPCGSAAPTAHGACGPCAAPEKKQHHFWPYKHGNDHHEPAKQHHKLTGCFRPYGGELSHASGYGYCESDEITIVRTEKKEEHVSVIHVKNKSKQHC